MESLYLLIPLSVVLVFVIAIFFWMSVRGGQFDDLEGPGFKVLMDDDKVHGEPAAKRGAGAKEGAVAQVVATDREEK